MVGFLAGPRPGHCGDQMYIWNLASGATIPLGKHTDDVCNEGPSGGSGITDIAVAGNHGVWLSYAAGNLADWTLSIASTTRRTERDFEFDEVDAEAPAPYVLGVADAYVLPYAHGTDVTVLDWTGKKFFTWKAPATVTNLTSYVSHVAVFVEGGKCYELAGGHVLATYTFPRGAVKEFALAGAGLIVQLPGGKVQILNRAGKVVKRATLPAGARMRDFAEGILLYTKGKEIHGLRVSDGKDVLLRRGDRAVLESSGLTYSAGRKIYSVAWVNVSAAFR